MRKMILKRIINNMDISLNYECRNGLRKFPSVQLLKKLSLLLFMPGLHGGLMR